MLHLKALVPKSIPGAAAEAELRKGFHNSASAWYAVKVLVLSLSCYHRHTYQIIGCLIYGNLN